MIFPGILQMFSSIPFAFGKMPEGGVLGQALCDSQTKSAFAHFSGKRVYQALTRIAGIITDNYSAIRD